MSVPALMRLVRLAFEELRARSSPLKQRSQPSDEAVKTSELLLELNCLSCWKWREWENVEPLFSSSFAPWASGSVPAKGWGFSEPGRQDLEQPCCCCCLDRKMSVPFTLAKLYFVLTLEEKNVWVETNADLPYPGKQPEKQENEENKPTHTKLKSLFHEVSWSCPIPVSPEEMFGCFNCL